MRFPLPLQLLRLWPAGHSRPRQRKGLGVQIEHLEDRSLLATYHWVGGLSGAWDTPSNWYDNWNGKTGVPGAADSAQISSINGLPADQVPANAQLTISLPSSMTQVYSLSSSLPVTFSNGSLDVKSWTTFDKAAAFENVAFSTAKLATTAPLAATNGKFAVHDPDGYDWTLSSTFHITATEFSTPKLVIEGTLDATASTIAVTDLLIKQSGKLLARATTGNPSSIVVANNLEVGVDGAVELGSEKGSTLHVGKELDLKGAALRVEAGFVSVGTGAVQNDELPQTVVIRTGGSVSLSDGAVVATKGVNIQIDANAPGQPRGALSVGGHARITGWLDNKGTLFLQKYDATDRGLVINAVLEVTSQYEQGPFATFNASIYEAYFSGSTQDPHTADPWLDVRIDPHQNASMPIMAAASLAGFLTLPKVPFSKLGTGLELPKPGDLKMGPLMRVEGIASGRFDVVDGLAEGGVAALMADRFMGVHYPTHRPLMPSDPPSLVEILFLETPRLLVKDGNAWLDHKPVQPEDKNRLRDVADLVYPYYTWTVSTKKDLILIAPGTAANVEDWPLQMAQAIAANSKIDADVAVFEWKEYNTGNDKDLVHGLEDWEPYIGSEYGIDIGEALAQWMWQSKTGFDVRDKGLNHYENVHLISHSGGSWLVDTLADSLKHLPKVYDKLDQANTQTIPDAPLIHLTLLDAFNPTGPSEWLNDVGTYIKFDQTTFTTPGLYTVPKLGESADYADHFFDKRRVHWRHAQTGRETREDWAAVDMTDYPLRNFYNVDVTRADPQLPAFVPIVDLEEAASVAGSPVLRRAHAWPRIYYLSTIGNTPAHLKLDPNLAFHYSLEARGAKMFPKHDSSHPKSNSPAFELLPLSSLARQAIVLDPAQTQTVGNATVSPQPNVNAILEPTFGVPASVTAKVTLDAVSDKLQLSVLFPADSKVTLKVTFDGQDLGTIDRTPLDLQGNVAAIADPEFDLGGNAAPGDHTLTLTAESPDPAQPGLIAIGPISFHRPDATTPAGPAPVKLLTTKDTTTTKRGKVTSTVTFTFDAKVTVAKDAFKAVDVNGKVLKVTAKTTFKNGQGIVTVKLSGTGPLTLRMDSAKIKGPKSLPADPDGDGIGGGIKELQLG